MKSNGKNYWTVFFIIDVVLGLNNTIHTICEWLSYW